MSEYIKALQNARKYVRLNMKELAAEAGITYEHIRRVFSKGVKRPLKYTANVLTSVMLRELEFEIRRNLDKISNLRRAHDALKTAHINTYGGMEDRHEKA